MDYHNASWYNHDEDNNNNDKKRTTSRKPGFMSGFFSRDYGKIEIFKKKQMVQPYMDSSDAWSLSRAVESNLDYRRHTTLTASSIIPRHLIEDIFSLYYNPSNKTKFDAPTKNNSIKFSILKRVNNSMLKIVSNDSSIASSVYTIATCNYLFDLFSKMSPEEQKKLSKSLEESHENDKEEPEPEPKPDAKKQKNKNPSKKDSKPSKEKKESKSGHKKNSQNNQDQDQEGGEEIDQEGENSEDDSNDEDQNENGDEGGGEDGGQDQANSSQSTHENDSNSASKESANARNMGQQEIDSFSESLGKMLDSKEGEKNLNDELQKAQEQLDELIKYGVDLKNSDDELSKDALEDITKIGRLVNEIKGLQTSNNSVFKVVNKILDKSQNYFSQKTEIYNESIFEADEVDNLDGLQFLHPGLRNTMLNDVENISHKSIGKIDLYIDISGSMSSGISFKNEQIERLSLAKALAIQMRKLNLAGDIYIFNGGVTKINNPTIGRLLLLNTSGGTDLNSVIDHIDVTNKNSLIITDAEDILNKYNNKAFWIGVGTVFSTFNLDVQAKKFLMNKQCTVYSDGGFTVPKASK